MADVVHLNYLLVPVMNRFGIKLGFGDQSIDEVCEKQNINVEFFLEIINASHDKNYFPKKQLKGFPIKLIVDYLRTSHYDYTRQKLPFIAKNISDLTSSQQSAQTTLLLLQTFFNEYQKDLLTHTGYEDKMIFPYVLEVEKAFLEKKADSELLLKIKDHFINKYAANHTNLENKLYDLKNLIIKYLTPIGNSVLYDSVLFELFKLENDLHEHARIEDKVLFPRILAMEKEIVNSQK